MKILFLSEVFPYPTTEGRRVAINPLLEYLGRENEIILVTFNDTEDEIMPQQIDFVSRYCSVRGVFPRVPVTLKSGLRNLFECYPLSLHRYQSLPFVQAVHEIVEREHLDLVHFYGVNMIQFWNLTPHLPRVLEGPDCTYMFFDQLARNPKIKPLRRLYYYIQMRKMRRFEAQVLPHFHQCFVVAPADRAALLRANPKIQVSVIPIGIQVPSTFETVQHGAEQSPTLVISGSMNADLNVQAVLFFYQDVLPLIRQQVPNVRLIIVGSNPDERIRRLAKNNTNIMVTGYVESIWPYIDQADVYVCPLFSASGAQTRMLEAMALGKAIVSTSFAANPLSLKSGEHVLIADDAEELAAHVVLLLGNPDIRDRLGAAARQAVASYKWETIIGQVNQLYQRTIDTARLSS